MAAAPCIPASACGVFGLKPSRGRLPAGPVSMEGWMGLSMNHGQPYGA